MVAANRDEFVDRPAAAPRVLLHDPWVVAGQDLQAGGTWLGLNEAGLVVGVLNRRTAAGPDPTRMSRGLLCLRVLQCRTLVQAAELLGAEVGDDYNPFTMLIASRQRAVVAVPDAADIVIRPLPAGVHLLTNLEVNDPTCPRIAKSQKLFEAVGIPPASRAEEVVAGLRTILADHSTQLDPRSLDDDNSLCIHAGAYGTRSSAVIALDAFGGARYWHCEGPPCREEFHSVALPRS